MKNVILLSAIMVVLMSGIGFAYTDMSTYFTCDNCTDCTNAINNNTYDTIKLNQSISGHVGVCLNNPANFSNKTFDCQDYSIAGDYSGIQTEYGLYWSGKNNVTLSNCTISGFRTNVRTDNSNNTNILENNFTTSDSTFFMNYIWISNSIDATIDGNRLISDAVQTTLNSVPFDSCIRLDGVNSTVISNNYMEEHKSSRKNIVLANTIDDATIYNNILTNTNTTWGITTPSLMEGTALLSNVLIDDNEIISEFGIGFTNLAFTAFNNVTVKNNNITRSTNITTDTSGYTNFGANSIIFENNTLRDFEYGIQYIIVNDSVVRNNTIIGSNIFIFIDDSLLGSSSSANNTFSNNTILDTPCYYCTVMSSINTVIFSSFDGLLVSFDVTEVNITSVLSIPSGSPNNTLPMLGKYMNITNTTATGYVFMNISYNATDVAPFIESSLKIYRYNGTAWENDTITGAGVNTANNYVYGNLTSFSTFGVFGTQNSSDLNATINSLGSLTEDEDFTVSGTITNDGNQPANNTTINVYVDGDLYYTYTVGDVDAGNSTSFSFTVPGIDEGNHTIEIIAETDSAEYDPDNNGDTFDVTVEERTFDNNPIWIGGPGQTRILPTLPTSFNTFPTFRVSFLNCLLEDTVVEIPDSGASVVLNGDIDAQGNPAPGTAAVLLYPQDSNQVIFNSIRCIEPAEYAVVACEQTVLASYEVDVESDSTYLCVNYEGYDVDPETISVQSAETGEWLELTNAWHNETSNIICANITAHTPYMVTGYMSASDAARAKTLINDAELKIEQAKASGTDTTTMQSYLDQALAAYKKCDWTVAADLAVKAMSAPLGENATNIILAVIVLMVLGLLASKLLKKPIVMPVISTRSNWKMERRKKYSKSDQTKRPAPHTRKKFWTSAYERAGKYIKGHWSKNPSYRK